MNNLSDKVNFVSIDKIVAKQFIRKTSVQLSIVFSLLAIGIFTSLSYSNFLHLQAQNIDKLSVFNEMIKPLSGVVLLLSLIVGMVTASQLNPYFHSKGQKSILQQMSLSAMQFFIVAIKVNLKFTLIPILYFITISLFIAFNSHLDLFLLLTSSVILLLGTLFYSLVILTISLNSKNVIFSILISFFAIVLIVSLDQVFISNQHFDFLTIFNKLFLDVREGSASIQELIHLILWLLFISHLIFKAIENLKNTNSKNGSQPPFIKSFFIALTVVVVILKLLSIILPEKTIRTSSAINHQVSIYFQNRLKNILNEVEITAVVDSEESRDEITRAVNQLKIYKQNIAIKFSNRQAFMNIASERDGYVEEFVSMQIGSKQKTIRYPFVNSASRSIAQLIDHIDSKSEQWITFIQGHDEVPVFSKNGRSLSQFHSQLKSLGYPVVVQNLRKSSSISDNTKLVIIADSKQNWLNSETEVIINYLNGGGHLLIMREAKDELPSKLENYLGVEKEKGILMDKNGFASGTPHPAILIINQFNQHPINQGINSIVAFPWSVGLNLKQITLPTNKSTENTWVSQSILNSHDQVWNDIELIEDLQRNEMAFNSLEGEVKKSFSIIIALEREPLLKNKVQSVESQRVLIVGDSSFISDTAINNYANLQLGINMINWLLRIESRAHDEQLNNQYQDNYIRLSPVTHFMLNWFFSLVFPFMLLIFFIYKRIKESK